MKTHFAKRPKLLFVVTEDWYFVSHRLELALSAVKAGYDVVLVTRSGSLREQIESYGIRIIPLEMTRRGRNPIEEALTVLRLAVIYRRERPDIVHHIALKPVILGGMAARLFGIKSVSAITGLGFVFIDSRRMPLAAWIIKKVLPVVTGAGLTITQNQDDTRMMTLCGVEPKSIRLIRGSGVDVSSFRPQDIPEGKSVVMFASRILWDKGVAEFVEAAEYLRRQGVDARFVLVGGLDDGNPAAVPLQVISDWVDSGVVEWWKRRDDMPDVLSLARIVCLPSYREGLPKVLLEAAACGRAIVTTDAPGCRDAVKNGDNGLLVPSKDARSLADAIKCLLNNRELCIRMGQRGRERAEREFSSDLIVEQTLAVYDELLDGKSCHDL